MKVFAFVDSQKADFSVKTLCRVCGVSRSGYYAWATRRAAGPSPAEAAEATLVEKIRAVHARSRGAYGAPRVHAELARGGTRVNHKRVERLMRAHGIAGRCPRRRFRTTVSDPAAARARDLLGRAFAQPRVDRAWVGDITYIPTDEGYLFLAAVLDACSRRVLGWSMAEHLRTELCSDALDAAVTARKGSVDGVIFHTDHGTQYTSLLFSQRCVELGISQSMGRVGNSYDNAMAESLWASLKRELEDYGRFQTRTQARLAVFSWLGWYNHHRLHSSLAYVPPVEYEMSFTTTESAA